nr:CoA transferase [Granulosicoccus sp.]
NNWNDVCAEINDPRLQDEQFAKAGRRVKNARALNQIIAEWAADKPWLYLYDFCQRFAIPGGPVLRGAELLDDPLYNHREYFARVEHQSDSGARAISVPGLPLTVEGTEQGVSTGGQKSAVPRYSDNTPNALPLSGKLVLDLGIFTAGSVTSTLLSDLGATVIKVESESYSDPFRLWPGIKGDSPLFTFNNRNKLGLNLDLKTEEGKARFLKLVAQADVVVENFRRGVLERLGIDYPVLKDANPNIVLASISGQGASGPGSGHVSFGSTLEAIGGVAALTGYPGDTCYISGRNLNYPDQIVCLYGAGAVMAALLKAQESGCGMHIDVSQREVTTLAVGEVVAAASLLGSNQDFPGNGDLNAYLQDIYRVEDGWLCVTVANESQAQALSSLVGCDLTELEARLPGWLGSVSSAAVVSDLRQLGVAAFRANSGAEASELEVIKSGNAFATTRAGKMVKGFPFQFQNNPLSIYEESPSMGEQTERILSILEA